MVSSAFEERGYDRDMKRDGEKAAVSSQEVQASGSEGWVLIPVLSLSSAGLGPVTAVRSLFLCVMGTIRTTQVRGVTERVKWASHCKGLACTYYTLNVCCWQHTSYKCTLNQTFSIFFFYPASDVLGNIRETTFLTAHFI